MQYPLISEYVRAIQDANSNLDKLAHLVPVPDDHGEPYRSSGAFAVVFKMKDERTGKCYALKCFTEEQEGRAESYRQIADELEFVDSPYLTSVKYLEKEIFVDSSCEEDEFPVLLMDWIDGETMENYIAENYQDNYVMAMLCYRFCKMAAWLRSQPFAHGDIKPDNIMVRPDGNLSLVDYDGMFVPAMKGQKSPTIGTKDFSHPLRTVDDFNETIDDFALASIALSLKAISMNSTLLDIYGASDRLLVSESDYRTPSSSKAISALQDLMCDKNFCTLYSLFMLALARKELSACSCRLFIGEKPIPSQTIEDLSTEITEDELKEAFIDERGVKYSKDVRKLLKVPQELRRGYSVKEGTRIICNNAFAGCSLSNIAIPDSVTAIGDSAFSDCSSLSNIVIPDSVTAIGDFAFSGCSSLSNIVIPDSVTAIGDSAFSDCSSLSNIVIPNSVTAIGDGAFFGCSSLPNIVIPNSVTSIGDSAFFDCSSLPNIVIPNSVTSIGDSAFGGCRSLSKIVIPDSVTKIRDYAFEYCSSLSKIVIPDSVTAIGDSAFSDCSSLPNIVIPNSVTSIGDSAFYRCSSLSKIVIPDSVTDIGNRVFSCCRSLPNIVIPNSVTSIEDYAFEYCRSLSNIVIPDSVTTIGKWAFYDCSSLPNIVIPNSVTKIGDYAFSDCRSLSNIVIPDSVTDIGDSAFRGCRSLSNIVIPDSVTAIGKWAFYDCRSLPNIVIPNSVTSIGDYAFEYCRSLSNIVIPDSVTDIGYGAFSGCSLSYDFEQELISRFGNKIFSNYDTN
jgi:serine/threonine protein kinase